VLPKHKEQFDSDVQTEQLLGQLAQVFN